MHGRRRSGAGTAAPTAAFAAAVALAGLVPGAASGDPAGWRAHIDGYPAVAGMPQAGRTLTASARWSPGDAGVRWSWLRCSSATDVRRCEDIGGATASTYAVAGADVGSYLRAVLVVTSSRRQGRDSRTSSAYGYSAPVGPVVAGPVVTPPTPEPRLMRPRPAVRISGRPTSTGMRVTLLTVRAPRGARVTVRCHGSSCPRRHWARATTLLHLVPFERRLRAGTRLVITVTKRGYIGERTVLQLRRGRQPRRVERCLYPGPSRPRRCPAP